MTIIEAPAQIERVDLDAAEGIVCTGPFDVYADPDTLRPQLLLAKQKGLKLLCANPDIVVDRGEERQWCAGAVAKLYTEMGGESLYFGKPTPPYMTSPAAGFLHWARTFRTARSCALETVFSPMSGAPWARIWTASSYQVVWPPVKRKQNGSPIRTRLKRFWQKKRSRQATRSGFCASTRPSGNAPPYRPLSFGDSLKDVIMAIRKMASILAT